MKTLLILLALLTSCYTVQYPVTPEVATASTYLITTEHGFSSMGGTAWVVNDHQLVTAGHMCEWSTTGDFTLTSMGGRKSIAHALYWQMDNDTDVCVLASDGPLAAPLVIAGRMPATGTASGYAGYPDGVFGVYKGVYLGNNEDSAPSDHGASGSAVFDAEGVFGVLVACRTDVDRTACLDPQEYPGFRFVPLATLVKFLIEGNIDYTPQPDSLPDYQPTQGLG